MKVLVCAASRHGATAEIGEAVARALSENGVAAEVRPPEKVADTLEYDALVLGSAVYAGRWLPGARDLADRVSGQLNGRPVWLFSSGPVGGRPVPEAAADVTSVEKATGAREHRVFGGKIVRAKLGLVERTVAATLRVADSDDRDWTEIAAWGKQIAEQLKSTDGEVSPEEGGAQ